MTSDPEREDTAATTAETPAPEGEEKPESAPGAEEKAEEAPEALPQTVEITDAGPCKKHIKVTVDRKAIDQRFDEKYTELVKSDSSHVRGFRPGKAPRKIVERRFRKEVTDQVKTEVLMASLEQLATDNKVNPLSPPDLDPNTIEIPDDGPLVYEFDVEVRPEFELPNYKGLKLRRPVHEFTDAEVEREVRRVLEPSGQIVPKPGKDGAEPVVELDDIVTADVTMRLGDQVLNELKEVRVKVDKRLVLADGVAEKFDKKLAGAKVGEQRKVDIVLSQDLGNPALRGKTIEGIFTIKDIKTVRPPELTEEFLKSEFGVSNAEQFRELVRAALDRRLEYLQRQTAREQILQHIAEASDWQLPQDLLRRQAQRTLARRVMEMRNAGMSEDQIRARSRLLSQDVLRSTAAALKEHFVLQKIAEVEKIEITDDDIDDEIERIAARSGESPRRVRARLEKEDMIEVLATELLERKALDLVLGTAEYEEYELNPEEDEGEAATVEAEAVPGSTEERPPEEAPAGEASPTAPQS
ncbi:MAG TPA: trigger factor [Gemmataceae bacterium]